MEPFDLFGNNLVIFVKFWKDGSVLIRLPRMEAPLMEVRGLRISWAMPAAISAMKFNFSCICARIS